IPQSDYHRLQAFFVPATFRADLSIASTAEKTVYERVLREYTRQARPIQEALARLEAPYRQKLHEQKLARLSDEAQVAHRTPAEKRNAAQKELVAKTARLLTILPPEVVRALDKEDAARHQELQRRLRKLDPLRPAPLPAALGLRDAAGPVPKTFVLERGERG